MNADANPGPDFIQLSANKDWAEYGELEGVFAPVFVIRQCRIIKLDITTA